MLVNYKSNIIVLSLIAFLCSAINYAVVPMLFRILISDHYDVLGDTVSLKDRLAFYHIAVLATPLMQCLSCVIISCCADFIQRKTVILWCLIIMTLGATLLALSIYLNSIWLILLGRTLIGIGLVAVVVAKAALFDQIPKQHLPLYMTLFVVTTGVAFVFAPFLGVMLTDTYPITWLYASTPLWVALTFSLINIILMLEFYKPLYFYQTKVPTLKSLVKHTISVFVTNNYYFVLLGMMMMNTAWTFLFHQNFVIWHQRYHYSSVKLGELALYIFSAAIIGLFTSYWLVTKKCSIGHVLKCVCAGILFLVLLMNFINIPYLHNAIILLIALCSGVIVNHFTLYIVTFSTRANVTTMFGLMLCFTLIPWCVFALHLLAYGTIIESGFVSISFILLALLFMLKIHSSPS